MAKRKYDTEQWAEQAAPATPPAGFLAIYPATDHSLHIKDPTGADKTLVTSVDPTTVGSITVNTATGTTTGLKVNGHASQSVDLVKVNDFAGTTDFFRVKGYGAGSIGGEVANKLLSKVASTSGLTSGNEISTIFEPAAASAGSIWNILLVSNPTENAQNHSNYLIGALCEARWWGSGSQTGQVIGIIGKASMANTVAASGPVTKAIGVLGLISTDAASNTITTGIGISVQDGQNAGKVTTMYGLKIEDLTQATNKWSIYTGSAPSYFGGEVTDERGSFANEGAYWMEP